MLKKLYYSIGGFILLIYTAGSLISMIETPPPKVPPQAKSFDLIRSEKGKFVYVPPPSRTRSYPGSSSGSTYPRSGGYSGGK